MMLFDYVGEMKVKRQKRSQSPSQIVYGGPFGNFRIPLSVSFLISLFFKNYSRTSLI